MSNIVKISVRSLVEYALRSGSITSGFRTSSSLTEGTKIHQMVQKLYKETDQKEVYVKAEISYEDLVFIIDGRCDGLLFSGSEVIIDEIKSTAGDLEHIAEDTYPVHWAQAGFYAYMYAKEHERDFVSVQVTYVQVETGEQKQYRKRMAFKELELLVYSVIKKFTPYARWQKQHEENRTSSIKNLAFPFERYREGQRKLAGAVYKTIAEQKNLFAQAPTGTGKTISTLFPAIKAMGEGLIQRIFYITAKTITRTAAEEAFFLMKEQGLHLNVVTITAKEKICFQEETGCPNGQCEFKEGYYDRINEAIMDLLSHESMINRAVIEVYARKHMVCPFEFSLDTAHAADAVICDYNYIFDPRVSLKRLLEEQKKRTVLLVDEAHNLVDRSRAMFSADLRKSHFLQLKRELKGESGSVVKAASRINEHLLSLKKRYGEKTPFVSKELDEGLVELVEAFILQAEKKLISQNETKFQHLLETYFLARSFIRIARLFNEQYVTYGECEGSEVYVRLFCLDPSSLLQTIGKGYRAKVFFSATFTPLSFYKELLGGVPEDYVISLPSPFAREHLDVRILPLSTRYRDRERTKESLVQMLSSLVKERPGNYLFFFPSYQYMNDIHSVFKAKFPCAGKIIVQESSMSEEGREQFLSAFQANMEESLIGFAVLGGIFSEGIDLKGNRLNGVVVVGVGLPQIGFERDIIKEYFTGNGKNGYDYAYVFPGMNKVVQAGGRLIRSEEDSGTIVLVDDRFLSSKYQKLLPEEWKHFTVENTNGCNSYM